jgi:uncharacterized MAPEG superfamily protein
MIDARSAGIVAATAAALFLKGLVVAYVQVSGRFRTRSFSRPEDARLMGVAPQNEPDVVVRAGGALRNESENAPYFLVLGVTYALLGGGPSLLLCIASLYVTARLFQTYAQVRSLQPQRMIGYLTGALATVWLAAQTALLIEL